MKTDIEWCLKCHSSYCVLHENDVSFVKIWSKNVAVVNIGTAVIWDEATLKA